MEKEPISADWNYRIAESEVAVLFQDHRTTTSEELNITTNTGDHCVY